MVAMQTEELRTDVLVAAVKEEIAAAVAEFAAKRMQPKLAAVVAGDDPSMLAYVRSKEKFAEKLGVSFEAVTLSGADQVGLEAKLRELSADPAVHGVILELPLAPGLDFIRALDSIDPMKDVDGLTPRNLGLALRGREEEALLAATPQACIMIAESLGPLAGRRVALIGKGKTVGRPLLPMLLNRHATVTVADSHTKDLKAALRGAEIVITATGKPGLITGSIIEEGQILIDAGLTAVGLPGQGEELKGDVDGASVEGIAAMVTPVPGGVGSLTTAILFRNLMKAMKLQAR